MSKQSEYIVALNDYINTFTTCYYETTSNNATFPFCVLIPPTANMPYEYTNTIMFDIEVYANDTTTTEQTEQLCDLLRNKLNEYSLNLADNFSSHISFESYYNLKENEQDILARRLTFSARIFYK